MKAPRIILPAISVGLMVTSRQASASVIDLGVVADSLAIAGTIVQPAIGTLATYTLTGLQYVGSHLNDVINGATITSILMAEIGAPNTGTLDFNYPGAQGASGGFTITTGSYPSSHGTIELSPNLVPMSLTSCTPNSPAAALPGCAAGSGIQILADAYEPAQLTSALEAAQILSLPGSVSDRTLTITTGTVVLDLGSAGGNRYQAEEIESAVVASASPTPEPASWSIAALGAAMLGWFRRRSARRS